MKEHQSMLDELPEDSFRRIYCNQQKEAAAKHKNGMRWHPLLIK